MLTRQVVGDVSLYSAMFSRNQFQDSIFQLFSGPSQPAKTKSKQQTLRIYFLHLPSSNSVCKKKTSFHKLKNIFNPTNPEIPNTSPHFHHIHQESRTFHPLTKPSQFPNNGGKYRPSPTRNASQTDVIPKTPPRHWDPQVRWSPQHPTGSPREGAMWGAV